MSVLVNLFVVGLFAFVTLYVCANFAKRQWAGLLAGAGILLLADVVYFRPCHGGYLPFIIGGAMSRSENKSLEGELGSVGSALSIYYGDHDRRFPDSLDELWKNGKYLSKPPRPAHLFALETPGKHGIVRPHWYSQSKKVKNFSSPDDSDDAGGWGYVNDDKSPHYGTFFVNCTHVNFVNGKQWNHMGRAEPPPPPAPVASGVAAPVAVRGAESLPPVLEGFSGRVLSKGQNSVVGAELVFTPENGGAPHSTTSDNLGRYRLDLPPGRYRVTVTHGAHRPYTSAQGNFVVRPGQRSYGNVNLQPL